MQQIKYLPYLYLLIHIFAIRITWLMARTSLLFSSNPILRHHNGQIYILFDSWFFPMCVYVCAYVCVCAWVRVCVCVCMRVCVTCTLYLVENNAVFNWVTEVVLDVGTFWADHTNTSWGEQFLSRLLLLLSLFPYPTLCLADTCVSYKVLLISRSAVMQCLSALTVCSFWLFWRLYRTALEKCTHLYDDT